MQAYFGETIADCIASLFMKADEAYIVILKKGDDKLDFKRIKKHFKIINLRFATKEEFEEITSLPFGAARVYMSDFRTVIDPNIYIKPQLSGGTGSFTVTFQYRTEDLRNLPNSIILSVTLGQDI